MYIKDLLSKREFSSEKPVKKDLIKSENFNTVLEGKFELNKNDGLFIEADEIRGIKCLENLVILGVQDGH